MNLCLYGERTIAYKDGNRKRRTSKQQIEFECWQTPTEVSYAIKSSPDPLVAYSNWVKENDSPYEEYDYADGNWSLDEEPCGKILVSPAEQHLTKLSEWLCLAQEEGYAITWSVQ